MSQGKKLRLVKGSHIIVPRLYEGEQCYVLQNEDRRIIFVMPYETEYSLIGTTEIPFAGDPSKARISADEISYLCAAVSRYFRKPLSPSDVVESFSGVRPLYDDGAKNASAATRDYVLDLDAPPGGAPLLSVFGGKITTYRRLAEDCHGQAFALSEAAARQALDRDGAAAGRRHGRRRFRPIFARVAWQISLARRRDGDPSCPRLWHAGGGHSRQCAEALSTLAPISARGSIKPRSTI